MRRTHAFLATLVLATAPVLAQTPPDLQPLPAVPPPPPEMAPVDASMEPEVTIVRRDGETIEEHRVGGRLYMIRVTPAHGVPYILVDHQGDGNFARHSIGGPPISVPMWTIGTF